MTPLPFFQDAKRLLSTNLAWRERTTLEKSYTAFFITVLLCLLPLPYEFYDVARISYAACLFFFFMAVLPDRKAHMAWFVLICGLLVLYNPFIPVRLGDKTTWTAINVISIFALYRARLEFDRPRPAVEDKTDGTPDEE